MCQEFLLLNYQARVLLSCASECSVLSCVARAAAFHVVTLFHMYFYYFVTATDFCGLKKIFNQFKLVVTSIQMIQVFVSSPPRPLLHVDHFPGFSVSVHCHDRARRCHPPQPVYLPLPSPRHCHLCALHHVPAFPPHCLSCALSNKYLLYHISVSFSPCLPTSCGKKRKKSQKKMRRAATPRRSRRELCLVFIPSTVSMFLPFLSEFYWQKLRLSTR